MAIRPFTHPHELEMDSAKGHQVINQSKSSDFILLEAIGTPKVYYAIKENRYFSDNQCKKEFTDEQLQALELPIPAEIESRRRKLIKAAIEAGEEPNYKKIYAETAPSEILPPRGVRERLVTKDPLETMINRVNRSTLGKL